MFNGYSGKLRYSSNVSVTNLESKKYQRRNTYFASIGYGKWIELKIGDTKPCWNNHILSGQQIHGIEFNTRTFLPSGTNIINLDVSYGETKRSVQPYYADSARVYGVYKRNIIAVRPSFGTGRICQWGFTFLKGRDKTSSLNSNGSGNTPKDNIVLGSDLNIRIFNGKLELFTNYALSFYTRNTLDGPIKLADIDSSLKSVALDPEAFSKLFIFNTSSTPISPYLTGLLNSSDFDAGFRLRTALPIFRNTLQLKYILTGNNYYSMGNPVTELGKYGFMFNDRITTLKNRIAFNIEYSRFTNNLDNLEESPSVNRSLKVQASCYYSPNAPGISIGYNMNNSQNSSRNYGFKNDINTVYGIVNYKYNLGDYKSNTSFYTNWSGVNNGWSTNTYTDTVRVTGDTTMSFSWGMYGINSSLNLPEGIPVELSAGFSTNNGSGKIVKMNSLNTGVRYKIIPGKLDTYLKATINNIKSPDNSVSGNQTVLLYGANYSRKGGHQVMFEGNAVMGGRNKPDYIHSLRYEWQF